MNGWLANQEILIEATTLRVDAFDSLNLSIHPNPSNGMIHVRFKTISNERIKISLIDLQGRNVFSSSFNADQAVFDQSISTEKFSNGVYLLDVSQGEKRSTKKLFILGH